MKNFIKSQLPQVVDAAVMVFALALAAAMGKSGSDAWWLLLPGVLAGYVADNVRRRAEAARDRYYAELMFRTFALGEDKTITVEHFHSSKPRDGGAA